MSDSADVSVVEVTDADRSAARNAVECVTDSPPKARPGFADLWEDDLAQAFARHRIAATPTAETTRVLAEALEKCTDSLESEIYAQYPVEAEGLWPYPDLHRRYTRDMSDVMEARAALSLYRSGEK